MLSCGVEVALEHGSLLAHVGSGVLRSATLHGGDGDEAAVGGSVDPDRHRSSGDHGEESGGRQHGCAHRRRPQACGQDRGQRHPADGREPGEQQGSADPGRQSQRAGDLRHGHRRQRHPSEGPCPSQELSQGERGTEGGPAPVVGRHERAGRGVHGRESGHRHRPPDHRQVHHPDRRRAQPGDAHQRRQPGPAPPAGLGEQLDPQRHPGEAQRPEAPRRKRSGQQHAGQHAADPGPAPRQRRGALAIPRPAPLRLCRHRAQPLASPGSRLPVTQRSLTARCLRPRARRVRG